jgi:hypothetical protein
MFTHHLGSRQLDCLSLGRICLFVFAAFITIVAVSYCSFPFDSVSLKDRQIVSRLFAASKDVSGMFLLKSPHHPFILPKVTDILRNDRP